MVINFLEKKMSNKFRREFLSFIYVGAFLFWVDYLIFIFAYKYTSAIYSRILSMATTAIISWALNRSLTFSGSKVGGAAKEFICFYLIVISVAVFNYSLSIFLIDRLKSLPVFFSIAISCLSGAFLNFGLLKKFVYK